MSDKILQQILEQMTAMQKEIKGVKEEMNLRFDRLDKSIDKAHMENISSDEHILSTLKEMNTKLDDRDHDVQALNKRVFKVESEIERLTRQ